jgi:putative transposase
VHAIQINAWKKQISAIIPQTFCRQRKQVDQDQQRLIDELYRQIGQLRVERDWLKKTLNYSLQAKGEMIDLHHTQLSVRRQYQLLGLNHSNL